MHWRCTSEREIHDVCDEEYPPEFLTIAMAWIEWIFYKRIEGSEQGFAEWLDEHKLD